MVHLCLHLMQPRFTKLLYTNRSQDKPRLNMNKDGDKIKTLVFSGRAFRSVAWDLTNQLTFKNIRLIVKPMLVAPILHIFHLSHFFKAQRILWWDMHSVHSVATTPFHPSTHLADIHLIHLNFFIFSFRNAWYHFTCHSTAGGEGERAENTINFSLSHFI